MVVNRQNVNNTNAGIATAQYLNKRNTIC